MKTSVFDRVLQLSFDRKERLELLASRKAFITTCDADSDLRSDTARDLLNETMLRALEVIHDGLQLHRELGLVGNNHFAEFADSRVHDGCKYTTYIFREEIRSIEELDELENRPKIGGELEPGEWLKLPFDWKEIGDEI
jgi:hypothetical protein